MEHISEAIDRILRDLEKEGFWVKELSQRPLSGSLLSTNICNFIVGDSKSGHSIILTIINSRVGLNVVIPLLSRGLYMARKTLLLVEEIDKEAERMLTRVGNFFIIRWRDCKDNIKELIKEFLRS